MVDEGNEIELFKLWKQKALEDNDIVDELLGIENSYSEIFDRFYKHLKFKTAGIRGKIGAGINRMNIFVVRRVTQAFAIKLKEISKKVVAIAYDSRIKSEVFAKQAAGVFCANGFRVKIFRKLTPVPVLSYVVRYFKCGGGVMITASHNSAQYNGYKAYGSDGCQLDSDETSKIHEIMNGIDMFDGVKIMDFEEGVKQGLIDYVSEQVEQSYLDCVKSFLINPKVLANSNISVVYSPLNGAGNEFVRKILNQLGVSRVHVVKEQEKPDGNFPTCKIPNPELFETAKIGLSYCETFKPDVLILTDPDCDRVGALVYCEAEKRYVLLDGNEIGTLLFFYVCSQKTALLKMPANPVCVKTIVSSNIVEKIAESYKVEVIRVLTGFKNIGKQITNLERSGKESSFVFGFEESNGYLAGSYVRDKDGVFSAALFCEMVAYYKEKNKSVLSVLNEIYEKYGFYKNFVKSYVFEKFSGAEKINSLMAKIRENDLKRIGNFEVLVCADYLKGEMVNFKTGETLRLNLPKSDVLEFKFSEGFSVVVRRSGTEPKIKIYYMICGRSMKEILTLKEEVSKDFENVFN